jgi:hypothetical protein
MRRRRDHRVTIDWSRMVGDHEEIYEVEGAVSPLIPARTNCSNDDAHPGEGGEVEILAFHLTAVDGKACDRRSLGDLPDLTAADRHEIEQALYEAAEDDDGPEPEEAWGM